MKSLLAFVPVAALSATMVLSADAVPAGANVRRADSFQAALHLVDAAQVRREPALGAYLRDAGISIGTSSQSLGGAPRVSRVSPDDSVKSFHVIPA